MLRPEACHPTLIFQRPSPTARSFFSNRCFESRKADLSSFIQSLRRSLKAIMLSSPRSFVPPVRSLLNIELF